MSHETLQEPRPSAALPLRAEIGHNAASALVQLAPEGVNTEASRAERQERVSDWNIEITPDIAEAVDVYFAQETRKLESVEEQMNLLTWAQEFKSEGAQVVPESSDPDRQAEQHEVLAKLEALGCTVDDKLASNLPYAIDRRLALLHSRIQDVYSEPVLPVTFVTDDELQKAAQLSEQFNSLLRGAKEEASQSGRSAYNIAGLSDVDIAASAKQAEADLHELLDTDMTMYSHTTNFLDKIIQSGSLAPRSEGGTATTGDHSIGVHFSREMYDKPRFGFDGPGLDDYLRKEGLAREDLLRGDIIFPLGALVEVAPIRAESSTPVYSFEKWDRTYTAPLNVKDPDSVEYVKTETMQKEVDKLTGCTKKQAGDTVFFADEDAERAYDYSFPINEAYLIVDEADEKRARDLLGKAGYSGDWIAEHLVVDTEDNGVQEVRARLNNKPARIVAPIGSRKSPNEYRDYTTNQQFHTQTQLTVMTASNVSAL